MSKKDYIALARAIHTVRSGNDTYSATGAAGLPRTVEERITSAIADVLAQDSPSFNRARFLETCETGSDKASAAQARKASKAALKAQRAECQHITHPAHGCPNQAAR
jgi:hypothetical protein